MTHHTDFRALCAELSARLDDSLTFTVSSDTERSMRLLIARARAALAAAPQQGAPSDDDLMQLLFDNHREVIEFVCDAEEEAHIMARNHVKFARAVLARYGCQAAPVPIAERLPDRGDLDANAYCWLWDGSSWERGNAIPMSPEGRCAYTHWLPHWALPLPEDTQ